MSMEPLKTKGGPYSDLNTKKAFQMNKFRMCYWHINIKIVEINTHLNTIEKEELKKLVNQMSP